MVVGRSRARHETRRTRRSSTSTGRWTTAESCCRCWVPTTTSTTSWSTGTYCGSVTSRYPIAPGTGAGTGRRGARPPALPADRLAQRDLRLPAILLDHLAGRSAPGGPRRVRRHPRRGQALVRRRTGRRLAHRPPGRIVRSGRLSRVAARDRPGRDGVDRHREDPRRRRTAGSDPARRRAPPATTRCARSAGCSIDPTGARPLTDLVDSTGSTTTDGPSSPAPSRSEAVTDTLASELSGSPNHRGRDRLTHTLNCPTRSPRCSANIGVYRSDYPAPRHRVAHRAGRHRDCAARIGRAARDRLGGRRRAIARRAVRLQQLCGAATAKSMEDCLFYRDPTPGLAERGRRRARPLRGQRRRVPPARGGAGATRGRRR